MKTQFIFNWFLLFTLAFNFILMTFLLIHWEFYTLYFDLNHHQQPAQSWGLSLLPIECPHVHALYPHLPTHTILSSLWIPCIHTLYPHLPTCPILSSLPTANRVDQLVMGMGAPLGCGWLTRGHTITESWLALSQRLPKASSSSASAGLSCPLAYSLLGLWLEVVQVFCVASQSLWAHSCDSLVVSRKHRSF